MSLALERQRARAWGWRDDLPAPTAPALALDAVVASSPAIHDESEGCGVHQNLWLSRHTGDAAYLARALAWARYYATTFLTDPQGLPGDRSFGYCHVQGYGLPALAQETGDTTHLDAAEAIATVAEAYWATIEPRAYFAGLNLRAVSRALLLFTALATSPRGARWRPVADRQADFLEYGFHPAGMYPAGGDWVASVFGPEARQRPACSLQQLASASWAIDEYVALSGRASLREKGAQISRFVDTLCQKLPRRLTAPHVILDPLSVDEVNGFPGHPVYAVCRVDVLLRGGFETVARACWEAGSGGRPGRMLANRAMTSQPYYLEDNHGGDIDYSRLLAEEAPGAADPITALTPGQSVALYGVRTPRILMRNFTQVDLAPTLMRSPVGRSYSSFIVAHTGDAFDFGGADQSHEGNDLERWRRATRTWQQMYPPEPQAERGASDSSRLSPLGRPETFHTYERETYDETNRRFLIAPASGLWAWPDDDRGWERLTAIVPQSNGIHTKCLAWDPDLQDGKGAILCVATTSYNHAVFRYDGGDVWTPILTLPAEMSWGEPHMAYHRRKKVWLLSYEGGPDGAGYYVLDLAAQRVTKIDAPISPTHSLSYDEGAEVVLLLEMLRGVNGPPIVIWTWDGTTFARHGVLPGPVHRIDGGVQFGKLRYARADGVHLFLDVRSAGAGGTGGNEEDDVVLWAYKFGPADASPPPPPPPDPGAIMDGYLDQVSTSGGVRGWARHPQASQTPQTVLIKVDGVLALTLTADENSADVGAHRFSGQLPAAMLDGQTHNVSAFVGTAQLQRSPKTVTLAGPPPPPPPVGLTAEQALVQARAYTDAELAKLRIVRG